MTATPMSSSDYSLISIAERYQYDARLDRVADLMDAGDDSWTREHPVIQDRAGIYRGFRKAHREAVKRGLITEENP